MQIYACFIYFLIQKCMNYKLNVGFRRINKQRLEIKSR